MKHKIRYGGKGLGPEARHHTALKLRPMPQLVCVRTPRGQLGQRALAKGGPCRKGKEDGSEVGWVAPVDG